MSFLVQSDGEKDKSRDEWINGGLQDSIKAERTETKTEDGSLKVHRDLGPSVTFTGLEISIIVTNVMKRIKVVN